MRKLNICQSIGILLINFLLIANLRFIKGAERTLHAELNPNCPLEVCSNETITNQTTLIHVRADGENDTLHYIWDLRRQPTILVALCAKDTNVSIEWNKVAKDVSMVNFTSNPIYTMSFVLTKIFIYDDIEDRATIIGVNTTLIDTIETKNLTWYREKYTDSVGEVHVFVSGRNEALLGTDGVINLRLKSYGGEDHDSVTPHLLHSINVTQIDMEFVDLSWNSSFTSTRIAAEFALVASESPKKAYKITKRKTIDDEHTPGIFTLVDVISPDGSNGTQGSYLQFRPISYTKPDRDITSKTDVNLNKPYFISDANIYLNSTIVATYYGEDFDKRNLVQLFNVSFGQTEDKFYSSTNYTTWTFVLGYGTAPSEHVSMIVAILACIGLGIPLILLIAAGVYLTIKRMRNC